MRVQLTLWYFAESNSQCRYNNRLREVILDFSSRFSDIGAIFEHAVVCEREKHEQQMQKPSTWWWQRMWSKLYRRYCSDSDRVLNFLPTLDPNQIIGVCSDALGATLSVHRPFKEPVAPPGQRHADSGVKQACIPDAAVGNLKESAEAGNNEPIASELDRSRSTPPLLPTDSASVLVETTPEQLDEKHRSQSVNTPAKPMRPAAMVKLSDSQLQALKLKRERLFELQEIVIDGLHRGDSSGAGPVHMRLQSRITGVSGPSTTSFSDRHTADPKDCPKLKVGTIESGSETNPSAGDRVVDQNPVPLPPPRSRSRSRVRGEENVVVAGLPQLQTAASSTSSSPDVLQLSGGFKPRHSSVSHAVDLLHTHAATPRPRSRSRVGADREALQSAVSDTNLMPTESTASQLLPEPLSAKRMAVTVKALEVRPHGERRRQQRAGSAFVESTPATDEQKLALRRADRRLMLPRKQDGCKYTPQPPEVSSSQDLPSNFPPPPSAHRLQEERVTDRGTPPEPRSFGDATDSTDFPARAEAHANRRPRVTAEVFPCPVTEPSDIPPAPSLLPCVQQPALPPAPSSSSKLQSSAFPPPPSANRTQEGSAAQGTQQV